MLHHLAAYTVETPSVPQDYRARFGDISDSPLVVERVQVPGPARENCHLEDQAVFSGLITMLVLPFRIFNHLFRHFRF